MSQFPSAIIFVNSDIPQPDGYVDGYINDLTIGTLTTQLFIDNILTFHQFNDLVASLPSFPDIVHLQNLRVLVILPDFRDYTNRDLADVVLFYSHGLITVEKNNFGPPRQTYPLERVNIYQLLRANNSSLVVILPQNPPRPGNCHCGPRWGPGGIVGIELRASDLSGVHLPNCDNEYNNEAFINRK